MAHDDDYYTIESPAQAEIKIKGSRFIGAASPVQDTTSAERFIQTISKKHYNATHNCFAFRVKDNEQITDRCSDAGEPAGTASLPMLNVLTGRNLLNIAVVVTRYFGGTKLGKGGLVRAYTECTQVVLENCRILKKQNLTSFVFTFHYDLTGNVMHLISQFSGKIIHSHYDQQTELCIEIPHRMVDNFKEKLIEVTSGKVNFE